MRECPNCGYIDPPYWRNRLFDYEVEICNIEELKSILPSVAMKLEASPRGHTIEEGVYGYRLTKTGWVYRLWLPILKVRGWSPKAYYDGAGSRASRMRKIRIRAYSFRKMLERKKQAKLWDGQVSESHTMTKEESQH